MLLIDPYIDYGEKGKNDDDLKDAEKKAHSSLDIYNYKIGWIKKDSDDALKNVPEVDFIYIDGEHSYKQTKKDMINYWNKLKVNGILAGHDICNPLDDFGVAKAFVEFCSEYNLKPYISRTDWWVIKGKEK